MEDDINAMSGMHYTPPACCSSDRLVSAINVGIIITEQRDAVVNTSCSQQKKYPGFERAG